MNTVLLAKDHLTSGMLGVPSLAGPIGYDIVGGNGLASFAGYIQTCFGNPAGPIPTTVTSNEIFNLLEKAKN